MDVLLEVANDEISLEGSRGKWLQASAVLAYSSMCS
jgi:hypothetical protein